MKKPFSETKVGQFVNEVIVPKFGDITQFIGEATGIEAIEKVGEFLNRKKVNDEVAAQISIEFESKKMDFALEMMKYEVQDRSNAREMRNEFTRRGKHDWLMYATAAFLLAIVGVMVYTGLYKELSDRQYETFCRLEGLLIGGALMMLFTFLWGTTRGSQRKTEVIDKMSNK